MLRVVMGKQGGKGFLFGFGRRGGGEQSESVRLGKLPRAIAADIDEIQVRDVFRRPLRPNNQGRLKFYGVTPCLALRFFCRCF